MITVHGPTARVGRLNASPFVSKLETWLRMAGLPYVFKPASPLKAPKGKVPYIEVDGQLMGDSQLILEHLTRKYGVTLDDHLSARERAEGRAIRRMLEEGTYFCTLHYRWVSDAGWAETRRLMKEMGPGFILAFVRRMQRRKTWEQGAGRHSLDDIFAMAIQDFRALGELVGDRPWTLGDQPSSVDATVLGFLHAVLNFPARNPIQDAVRAQANLVSLHDRGMARWWPEGEVATR